MAEEHRVPTGQQGIPDILGIGVMVGQSAITCPQSLGSGQHATDGSGVVEARHIGSRFPQMRESAQHMGVGAADADVWHMGISRPQSISSRQHVPDGIGELVVHTGKRAPQSLGSGQHAPDGMGVCTAHAGRKAPHIDISGQQGASDAATVGTAAAAAAEAEAQGGMLEAQVVPGAQHDDWAAREGLAAA